MLPDNQRELSALQEGAQCLAGGGLAQGTIKCAGQGLSAVLVRVPDKHLTAAVARAIPGTFLAERHRRHKRNTRA